MKKKILLAIFVGLTVIVAGIVIAVSKGSISGSVTDSSGAVLPPASTNCIPCTPVQSGR